MTATPETLKKNIDDTTQAARRTAETVGEMAKDTAASIGAEMSSRVSHAAADLRDGAADLRDSAAERLESTRDALSESGERFAETLRRAAEEAQTGVMQSRVYTAAAHGISTAADAIRDRNILDIAADVRALAHRHPGAFAAGAAVAGFALARFLRSSSTSGGSRS